MPDLRVLFEYQQEQKRAVLCADGSSNFLVLCFHNETHLDSFVTADFLFGIGHAHSFLMEGLSMATLEQLAEEVTPIKGLNAEVEAIKSGALLKLTYRKKTLFRKHFNSELDAQMMGESYLSALQGWQMVKVRTKNSVAVVPMLSRRNEQYIAQIECFENGDEEAPGILLNLIEDGNAIFARFGLFTQAVDQANTLVSLDPDKKVVYRPKDNRDLHGGPLKIEHLMVEADEEVEPRSKPLFEYVLNNIRTTVTPTPQGSGFKIDVYVDGTFITQVFKDSNEGGFPYTLPQSIKKAQNLLNRLQGWSLTI